jgi:hypothetical protein
LKARERERQDTEENYIVIILKFCRPYSSPNIIRMMTSRRVIWPRHVSSMGGMGNTCIYASLVGNAG